MNIKQLGFVVAIAAVLVGLHVATKHGWLGMTEASTITGVLALMLGSMRSFLGAPAPKAEPEALKDPS